MSEFEKVLEAAKNMDWQQVVLNGGPPCFHLEEDGRFCGRAETWDGHDVTIPGHDHAFVSLHDLLSIWGGYKDDYDTLVGLMKKRFPMKDGVMPDCKVEDLFEENESLRATVDHICSLFKDSTPEYIATVVGAYVRTTDGVLDALRAKVSQLEHNQKVLALLEEPCVELEKTFPVVLYFNSPENRDEFSKAVRKAKPNLKQVDP